jgi:hypothetical protein
VALSGIAALLSIDPRKQAAVANNLAIIAVVLALFGTIKFYLWLQD